MFNKALIVAAVSMCVFAPGAGLTQQVYGLTVDLPDRRTLATQQKVEKLFEAGDYDRAFFIYRNELATVGDKYAQYMVGYMYLTGNGVDEDYSIAAAWYRLAAERDTAEFMAVRDQLLADLSPQQAHRSRTVYDQLRQELGDLAIILESIKRKTRELDKRTGTRLRSDASPMTVIESRGPNAGTSSDYYDRLEKDIEARLQQLKNIGEFEDLDTDLDNLNIIELERLVEERLASN